MNGLELVVFGIIAVCVFMGYRAGFLKVIYSLFSWVLVLVFVTWSTPYIAEYLEKNTRIQATIQEQCVEYLKEKAENALSDRTEEYGQEQQQNLEDAGIWLPKDLMEEITGSAAVTIGEALDGSGVYGEVAASIAHFIVEGIAFFIALIVAGIFAHWLMQLLNLVSHLPILHGANKTLGAVAGILKGLVVVWLGFYVITICGTSEWGKEMLTYVRKSAFLSYLYQHNILLQIIRNFL